MKVKLKPEEKQLLENLKKEEELCIEKYKIYAQQAHDPELTELFNKIEKSERTHLQSITQVLAGEVPAVGAKDSAAASYNPVGTYKNGKNAKNKKSDAFLCTDSISTEKYVSGAYDNNLFHFGDTNVRKLLNDIQTEEQNHAEMIYKYKQANDM